MSVDDANTRLARQVTTGTALSAAAAAVVGSSGIRDALAEISTHIGGRQAAQNAAISAAITSPIRAQVAAIQATAALVISPQVAAQLRAVNTAKFKIAPMDLPEFPRFALDPSVISMASQLFAQNAIGTTLSSPYCEGAKRIAEHTAALAAMTGVREAAAHVKAISPVEEWAVEVAASVAAARAATLKAQAEAERSAALEGTVSAVLPVQQRKPCPFAERMRRDASARAKRGDRAVPRRRVGARSPTSSGSGSSDAGAHNGGLGGGPANGYVLCLLLAYFADDLIRVVIDYSPLAVAVYLAMCAPAQWRERHRKRGGRPRA